MFLKVMLMDLKWSYREKDPMTNFLRHTTLFFSSEKIFGSYPGKEKEEVD